MKKFIAAMLTVLMLTFTACGVNVTEGKVSDMRIEEAHTTEHEIMEQECEWDTDTKTVNGKTKTTREYECEDVGTGEYETKEHPAEYYITLEDKDGNDQEHQVSQDVYDSLAEGDTYKIDK